MLLMRFMNFLRPIVLLFYGYELNCEPLYSQDCDEKMYVSQSSWNRTKTKKNALKWKIWRHKSLDCVWNIINNVTWCQHNLEMHKVSSAGETKKMRCIHTSEKKLLFLEIAKRGEVLDAKRVYLRIRFAYTFVLWFQGFISLLRGVHKQRGQEFGL